MDFESDAITLDIPMKGISIDGWAITPVMRPMVSSCDTITIHFHSLTVGCVHPQVTKKQVDNIKEGKLTPHCDLSVTLSARKKKKVPILKHEVNLQGAKPPYDMFVLILPAGGKL